MKYELRLFVAGNSKNSQNLIIDLKKFFNEKLENYSFRVFDVIEKPEFAEKKGILATPLLEKESSKGKKRIFGDLSNKKKLLELVVP